MKRRVGAVAMAAGAVLAMGGCHLILGLDEYQVEEEGGASCEDKVRNGGETDVDCGGSCSVKCADFQGCQVGTDCASVVCVGGTCRPPACDDGVKNGKETGLDCGGECAGLCKNGEGCNESRECQSGVCRGGACVDYYEWGKALGQVAYQTPIFAFGRIATDGVGNILLADSYIGTVDFGGGPLSSSMPMGSNLPYALAFAKIGSDQGHVWSKIFGAQDGLVIGTGLAVDAPGNIYSTGFIEGAIDFECKALGSSGFKGIFVAKLDGAGTCAWASSFAADIQSFPEYKIAADDSHGVIVAGQFTGSLDFGGNMPLMATGTANAFVAKFDAAGKHVWSRRVGGMTAQDTIEVVGVSFDKAGNIIVAGDFAGKINLGGQDLSSKDTANDLFLVKLDGSGNHVWSEGLGGYDEQRISDFHIAADGGLVLGGTFKKQLDMIGGFLYADSALDGFVAKLDGSGKHVWSKHFANSSLNQTGAALAIDAKGGVTLAGLFLDKTDFGGGPIMAMSAENMYVAKLDASGNHIWSRGFNATPVLQGIVALGAGDVALTGIFGGTLALGDPPLKSVSNGASYFLAKLRTP